MIKKPYVLLIILLGLFLGTAMNKAQTSHGAVFPVWEPQLTGTFESLRGVSAVSSSVVWASGSHGTVLRTIDGGKNWVLRPIPGTETLDFRDIQAFDENSALVINAGSPAKIYKTTDGGITWQETYNNTQKGIFFDAMAFWDKNKGLAFSDPVEGHFVVITTADQGSTWQTVPPQNIPAALPGEAAFAASGTALTTQGTEQAWFCTGGAQARVFHTPDGGKTWQVAHSPLLAGKDSCGGFALAFMDDKKGILVGGDYKEETKKKKNAALTTDGGKTWKLITGHVPQGFREGVVFIPALHPLFVITVGPSGSDYSTVGGLTWKNFSNLGFHSISIAPGTVAGWAVGAKGQIAKLLLQKKQDTR